MTTNLDIILAQPQSTVEQVEQVELSTEPDNQPAQRYSLATSERG